MNTLDNKLIIYDSNCKVCITLREWILKLSSIPETKIVAYKDLSSELSNKVDPERFKNVMALIDTNGGKTMYGEEGVAYIFSSEYKLLKFLFKLDWFKSFFTTFYKTIAYNRYIIATPKNNIACDCFPDNIKKYRVNYIVLTISFSVLLTALFGWSLKSFLHGMTSMQAAFEMLLIAGSGWIVQIVIALLFNKSKPLEYIGHLGSIMVVGLLVLIPWMLLHAILGINSLIIPMGSVMVSSLLMLYLHIHRATFLQLSQWWTASWFFALQSTAVFWIYIFHIN